jgi:hypothetical protein
MSSVLRTVSMGTLLLSATLLAGCATTKNPYGTRYSERPAAKYTVTGSRIARGVDVVGGVRTGAPVQTITDEQLQQAQGMLLSEKLGNGFKATRR